MRKEYLAIVILFLLAFLIQPVASVQPQISVPTQSVGIQIQFPTLTNFKLNDTIELHFHTYNTTSGTPLTNATTNCSIHIYNSTGSHIIDQVMAWDSSDKEWEYEGNVPTQHLGQIEYIVWCVSAGGIGGFIESGFDITPTGFPMYYNSTGYPFDYNQNLLTSGQAVAYSMLLIVSIVLLLASLYFAFTINGDNLFTMGGDLVEVNLNKYLKMGLYFIAYLFAITTTFLAWQMADAFYISTLGSAIFGTLFTILYMMLPVILILVTIIGFVQWLADAEIHKLAERHLKPR